MKTAYQRWKEAGMPRPFLKEVIAHERFDFFSAAALLLAVLILYVWLRSVWAIAFPERKDPVLPVEFSRSESAGVALFSQDPDPTPTPTLVLDRVLDPVPAAPGRAQDPGFVSPTLLMALGAMLGGLGMMGGSVVLGIWVIRGRGDPPGEGPGGRGPRRGEGSTEVQDPQGILPSEGFCVQD